MTGSQPMKIFFILALGRSGTNFLATLLARDPRGRVQHEPYRLDPRLMLLRHAGGFERTLELLLEERFRALLPDPGEAEFYGEVNSYLRYEAEWLRSRFDATVIQLVRDGRDFVRSAWIRGVYTPAEPDGPILPADDDPFAPRWAELSRFQRLCWYWMHSNEQLAAGTDSFVRFEDLLVDYGIFRERVLEPTGVHVSEELWRREVARPRNTSLRFRTRSAVKRLLGRGAPAPAVEPLPHWSDWDAERSAQFWEICEPAMRRFGYGK